MKHRSLRVGLEKHPRGLTRVSRRSSHELRNGQHCCYKVMCGIFATWALFTVARFALSHSNAATVPDGTSQGHGKDGLFEHEGNSRRWPIFGSQASSEEIQVRKEIAELEAMVEEKESQLHDAEHDWQPHGGKSRVDGVDEEPITEPQDNISLRPRSTGKTGGLRGRNDPFPSKFQVHGEPLFGPNPIRRPLASDPALHREPVPLIVGGTDGSGTRGVVALLQRLQVPMLVEDGGTLDVHAGYMAKGGWPNVVKPVLDWARGPSYDAGKAPHALRASTSEALVKLRSQMERGAGKLLKDKKGTPAASYVSWGLKAPVSMILVPFFQDEWGRVKFLHVVRDGRDIAFSGNQTPVTKFYEHTFPDGSRERKLEGAPLKAIRMWSSWNIGLYEWASGQEAGSATHVDYLLLHAEDLMDPASKFAAIKDVAEFVGSPLSDKELCCIATESAKDLGSHTTVKADRGKVTNRFGKWKVTLMPAAVPHLIRYNSARRRPAQPAAVQSMVEGEPELAKRLQQEGEEGLRLFGYEPERSARLSDGYPCLLEREPDCPQPPDLRLQRTNFVPPKSLRLHSKKMPDAISDTPECVGLVRDTDFRGNDWQVAFGEDHLECCQECRKEKVCTHFTFDYSSGNCYLKTGKGRQETKQGLLSGAVASKSL